MNILLVDDEVDLVGSLARALHTDDLDITPCTDPLEALRLVRSRHFALIITDHRMPGMTGTELLEAVKHESPDTLRYMLTGYADVTTAMDGINRGGIHRFFTKPWDLADLRKGVAEGLASARLQLQQRRLAEELRQRNAELQQVNAELERLANRDPMTGLLHRAQFDDHLRELVRAWSPGHPCALVLLDADEFKAVNDTHGHPVGDAVLREIAVRLAAGVRTERDTVYRYGGEEFAVLLPDTDLHSASRTAERLRAAIADAPIPTPAGPLAVTVSVGVGALQAEMDGNALLAAVDAALYQAKRAGKNRVTLAQPD